MSKAVFTSPGLANFEVLSRRRMKRPKISFSAFFKEIKYGVKLVAQNAF